MINYNDVFPVEGNKNDPLIYSELHESLLFCLHTVSEAGRKSGAATTRGEQKVVLL
jgi:hypothetical protein